MSEQITVKPIGEVLRSRRFQKEISLLLFFFAAVETIFSVFAIAGAGSQSEVLFTGIAGLMVAIVYVVLAILIRNGSVVALVFTGILFTIDTLAALFGPSWETARGMLLARGLLIVVLVRFIQRERRTPATR
jgi:hypothetical protein